MASQCLTTYLPSQIRDVKVRFNEEWEKAQRQKRADADKVRPGGGCGCWVLLTGSVRLHGSGGGWELALRSLSTRIWGIALCLASEFHRPLLRGRRTL
jgi:hypothetical protein